MVFEVSESPRVALNNRVRPRRKEGIRDVALVDSGSLVSPRVGVPSITGNKQATENEEILWFCSWLHFKLPQKNLNPNTTISWYQGVVKLRLSGQRK